MVNSLGESDTMKRSALLLAFTSLVAAGTAQAQVGTLSTIASVTLNATQASTLVVTANTPASSITSIAANTTTDFAPAVNVTTAWNLTGGANVQLVGYFGIPSQALASGTNYIPSSRVEGRIGGDPFTPFTGPAVGGIAGVAGGSLVLFTQALGALAGTRTDDVNLRLNFTGQSAPAAGSYTGTLNLRAVVQ
jgi:hypothetical protein